MQALDPTDPRTVGPYRLLARIASGGTATVYLARSAGGRTVAVKLVHGDLAGDPRVRARFAHEVAATRAASGAYSPALLDADEDAHVPWLVLEFLPAVSLRDAVRLTGPLPPDAVAALAVGVAEALRSLHATGLVHLDVNPANILLTADGPRLIDFGLAGAPGAPPGPVAGAPGFIAPELLTGARAGPAADVYGLGATLAFAATGSRTGEIASIGDADLRDAVRRCLSRDPAVRPELDELLRLPAPTGGTLPPDLSAAIRDRATAAADPPPPAPMPPVPATPTTRPGTGGHRPAAPSTVGAVSPARTRRRVLLAVAAAGLVVAGLGAVRAVGAPDGDSAQGPDATASSAPPGAPSPSPSLARSATDRTLTFACGGNSTVARLVYTVGGKATTVRDVRVPWTKDVRIPSLPARIDWALAYSPPIGSITCQVTVDGTHLYTISASGTPGPDGRPSTELLDGKSGTA